MSQVGKKNKKMFRLVISEKARDPFGKALEILGSYNPYSKELKAKTDRITYWISKGASLSASVNNLFINQGIIKGEKAKTVKISNKRKAKITKKTEDDKKAAEAKAAKAEAAKAAAAAAAEAPAEAAAEIAEKAE
jgi:small subunit ribosomal protein S16